jgi:hypothetical protein
MAVVRPVAEPERPASTVILLSWKVANVGIAWRTSTGDHHLHRLGLRRDESARDQNEVHPDEDPAAADVVGAESERGTEDGEDDIEGLPSGVCGRAAPTKLSNAPGS